MADVPYLDPDDCWVIWDDKHCRDWPMSNRDILTCQEDDEYLSILADGISLRSALTGRQARELLWHSICRARYQILPTSS